MNTIKIRLAARWGAAGRPNNEDNFLLTNDLSKGKWEFITDEVIPLNKKGILLVICDGMGGMNAGEVASTIAVETIKKWFSPERLTSEVTGTPEKIKRHIAFAIVAADARIKEEARTDKTKEGMGSTIVLAWLIGQHLYAGWCGDSRLYRYNPAFGLHQLSHDHSYVQELVDAGKLSPDLAFDHPNSNIITRSLGDPRQKARPDVQEFQLYNDDIILLCSDGLSGVLRDREMEALLATNRKSMATCLNALWHGAENAGWHDNVTITLCQVVEGAATPQGEGDAIPLLPGKSKKHRNLTIGAIVLALLLGITIGYIVNDCLRVTPEKIDDQPAPPPCVDTFPPTPHKIRETPPPQEHTSTPREKSPASQLPSTHDEKTNTFPLPDSLPNKAGETPKEINEDTISTVDALVPVETVQPPEVPLISPDSITINERRYRRVVVNGTPCVEYPVPTGKGWQNIWEFAKQCGHTDEKTCKQEIRRRTPGINLDRPREGDKVYIPVKREPHSL
ncbi:MAG: protein phosphatase 2C domain-containing protein [Odoribacteraceae bacterium]|jgi:serine/threonine protein phosphatase PrpC|nr:protein phosphatase 2C domain-containing protein [Odoribacteraceae bacterium]